MTASLRSEVFREVEINHRTKGYAADRTPAILAPPTLRAELLLSSNRSSLGANTGQNLVDALIPDSDVDHPARSSLLLPDGARS